MVLTAPLDPDRQDQLNRYMAEHESARAPCRSSRSIGPNVLGSPRRAWYAWVMSWFIAPPMSRCWRDRRTGWTTNAQAAGRDDLGVTSAKPTPSKEEEGAGDHGDRAGHRAAATTLTPGWPGDRVSPHEGRVVRRFGLRAFVRVGSCGLTGTPASKGEYGGQSVLS